MKSADVEKSKIIAPNIDNAIQLIQRIFVVETKHRKYICLTFWKLIFKHLQ